MAPRIPLTDSIQQLATLWQHHDVTDFEDQLEEVPGPVFRRDYVVGIPLTRGEHRAIREAAASRCLDEAASIHEWLKEKLGRLYPRARRRAFTQGRSLPTGGREGKAAKKA